jgi:hypothetical protein
MQASGDCILGDIFIDFNVVKNNRPKKNWDGVKFWRKNNIYIPEDQLKKRAYYISRLNHMFGIELETSNEDFNKWNRKLFAVERAVKILNHLQKAESMIGKADLTTLSYRQQLYGNRSRRAEKKMK